MSTQFDLLTKTPESGVKKDALISPCGLYRYWLTRRWDDGAWLLPIIMLNPSTADSEIDDPTIRRCMSFARRERFGGVGVMNLFAFRATSPADMKAAADPYGPHCAEHLDNMMRGASENGIPILAAWGAHGSYRNRAAMVKSGAKGWGARMICLGTTANGSPKHPLYVKGDQPFVDFG
jgi:hypothetical protein